MKQEIIHDHVTEDVLEILYQVPTLKEIFQKWGEGDVFLAGGAIRTLFSQYEIFSPEETDIDLFFRNGEIAEYIKKALDKHSDIYNKVFECPEGRLTTFLENRDDGISPWKIQLITFDYYNSGADLIGTFDFTPTMFATDGKLLWYGDRSINDTMERRLRWNVITYPASSLRRMMKYARKGYYMTEEDYREFVTAVWEHSPGISDHELVYVD